MWGEMILVATKVYYIDDAKYSPEAFLSKSNLSWQIPIAGLSLQKKIWQEGRTVTDQIWHISSDFPELYIEII